MVFEIKYAPAAEIALRDLRKPAQAFIKKLVDELETEPELKGQMAAGIYRRYWKLNYAGQYQVTYTINRKLNKVTIVSISTVFP